MSQLETALVGLGQAMHREDQTHRKPRKRKAHKPAPVVRRPKQLGSRLPPVRPGHVTGGFDVALDRMSKEFNRKIEQVLERGHIAAAAKPRRKAPKRKAAAATPKPRKAPKRKHASKASKFEHGPVYGPTREEFLARMAAGRAKAAKKRGKAKSKKKVTKKKSGKGGKKKGGHKKSKK